MNCEKYKRALRELAAVGMPASGQPGEHLAACRECEAAFQSEQQLHAEIDRALRERTNVVPSQGFASRVRAEISRDSELRSQWNPLWGLAAAALVLAAIGLTHLRQAPRQQPHRATVAMGAASVVPSESAPQVRPVAPKPAPLRKTSARSRHATPEPEVLVPPEEGTALRQFMLHLSQDRQVAEALVKRAPSDVPDEADSLPIPPVQIAGLQFKPLVWEKWK